MKSTMVAIRASPDQLAGAAGGLSTDIAQQIRLRVSPDRILALQRRQTHSGDALDAYFKAEIFRESPEPREHRRRRCKNTYKQAMQLDPNYALAWTGLASTYAASTMNSDADPSRRLDRLRKRRWRRQSASIRISAEAQKLDGTRKVANRLGVDGGRSVLPTGHPSRSERRDGVSIAWTRPVAIRSARRRRDRHAPRTRPRPSGAHGERLVVTGRVPGCDFPAAIDYAKHAITHQLRLLDRVHATRTGVRAKRRADSRTASSHATRHAISQSNSKAISLNGYLLAKMGNTDAARDVLKTLEAASHDGDVPRYVPPYASALVYLGLGERDTAFEWLNKAFDVRDVHLIYLPVDPKWDAYRSDPRFVDLLARCGFPTSR